MKCVILAGGFGTRLSEETVIRPKPMVKIGNHPILWHIMKIYSSHGVSEFIICLGYKGYIIKEYFANYSLHNADVSFDFKSNEIIYHKNTTEPWKVTLIDTGPNTMTGGRIKRIRDYLDKDEPFCMTYGDGVSNIDITSEIKFHNQQGCKATMACVRPPARFGSVEYKEGKVSSFLEKPASESGLINGGFFVLNPSVLDYVSGDDTYWEREPLENLAKESELSAWVHEGFWQPMDTQRDKMQLEKLWEMGDAPWKIW